MSYLVEMYKFQLHGVMKVIFYSIKIDNNNFNIFNEYKIIL